MDDANAPGGDVWADLLDDAGIHGAKRRRVTWYARVAVALGCLIPLMCFAALCVLIVIAMGKAVF